LISDTLKILFFYAFTSYSGLIQLLLHCTNALQPTSIGIGSGEEGLEINSGKCEIIWALNFGEDLFM